MPDDKQLPVKKKRESLDDLLKRKREMQKGGGAPSPETGGGDPKPAPVPAPAPAADVPRETLSADQQRLLDAMDGKVVDEETGKVTVKTISVELIDPNPAPQRTVYLPEEIALIAQSLKETEQRDPVHVRPNPDAPGRYIICDGWTRVQAVKEHGLELGLPTMVEAKVHTELDGLSGALYGRRQNKERHELTDLDDAFFFRHLQDQFALGSAQVMEMMGIKERQYYHQYMCFLKLAPEVLEVVRPFKYVFTKTFAEQVSIIQERHGVPAAMAALEKLLTVEADGTRRLVKGAKNVVFDFKEELDKREALGQSFTGGQQPEGKKPQAGSRVGAVPVRHGKLCKLVDDGKRLAVTFKHKELAPAQKAELRTELEALFKKYFPLDKA